MNGIIRKEGGAKGRRREAVAVEAERLKQGIVLDLYIQPGASTTAFAGIHNNKLKIRLQARAIDGAANKSLCQFLSQEFHVSKSSVILRKGAKSREKQVFIAGETQALTQKAEAIINAGQET